MVATGGNNSVTLSWSANSSSDNVVKYNIYQHTAPFSPSSSYLIGNTSNTTFTISGLDNGTRYYFRVAAVNASNLEGTASNTINLTPAFLVQYGGLRSMEMTITKEVNQTL